MPQSLSKIKKLALSMQHKERKCTNKKVVLKKKKPKSRSNELYVKLFFDAVQPNVYRQKIGITDQNIQNFLCWV